MAGLSMDHPWAFTFGLLGNFISFLVYLAPMPTFYGVFKKKSTEGFHSIPYIVALFSAMLWIFYAFLKPNSTLLITINSFGCCIETAYIITFLIYAPKVARQGAVKLIVLLNFAIFGAIIFCTLEFAKGAQRATVLGWICMIFSVCVFVAPLSIIRLVIRTRSVEFMPFSLSFFLTISAVVWFMYGLLTKDLYVALPNVLGFIFGVLQMILYVAYKERKKVIQDPTLALPEHIVTIEKLGVEDVCTNDVKPSTNDLNVDEEKVGEEVKVNDENRGFEEQAPCVVVNCKVEGKIELNENHVVNQIEVMV